VARHIFNDLKHAKLEAKLWPMDNCNPTKPAQREHRDRPVQHLRGRREAPVGRTLLGLARRAAGPNDAQTPLLHGLRAREPKYSHFNQTAKQFDFKLEGLGASAWSQQLQGRVQHCPGALAGAALQGTRRGPHYSNSASASRRATPSHPRRTRWYANAHGM